MPRYIIHAHTAVVNEGPQTPQVTDGSPKYDIHTDTFVVNEHTPSAAAALADGTAVGKADTTADASDSPADILPPDLLTSDAVIVWQELIAAELLTPDWQLAPSTTKMQGMYIAMELSDRFLGKIAWRPFERLWHRSNMAQTCQKMKDTGQKPKRWKEIADIVVQRNVN